MNSMEVILEVGLHASATFFFYSGNPPTVFIIEVLRLFLSSSRFKAAGLCRWCDSSRRPRSSPTSCTGNCRPRRRHCP